MASDRTPPQRRPAAAAVPSAAAGDASVVSTFDTVMPNVTPQLDDGIDAIEATTSESPDLTPAGRGVLEAAQAQIGNAKTVVERRRRRSPTRTETTVLSFDSQLMLAECRAAVTVVVCPPHARN